MQLLVNQPMAGRGHVNSECRVASYDRKQLKETRALPMTLRRRCCCFLAVKVRQSRIGSFAQCPSDARPEYVAAQRRCAFPIRRGLSRAVSGRRGSHAARRCVIRSPSTLHRPGVRLPVQGEPVCSNVHHYLKDFAKLSDIGSCVGTHRRHQRTSSDGVA